MKLIGLTGGIASGKSLVVSFLKKKKIPVVDADRIAHEVIKPKKPAYRVIVTVFGDGILNPDKTINRSILGEIVFSHPEKRRILESTTHPEILKKIQEEISGFKRRKAKMVVIDAPLLFESGLNKKMDLNVLVKIDPNIQLKRLMKRDKLSETQAMTRILSQMSTVTKEKLADFVIDNSGTSKQTERQLLKILSVLLGLGHDRDHRAP
ncbi:MAG: dephospho-CoA kinase [Deltaproteobacteria bacterium]|nr:dephospho-CoA kinase [Deltaproteobacteria bacterium]